MSAPFPWGGGEGGREQCDPAAQVKGKCTITPWGEARLLGLRVGESSPTAGERWGARVLFSCLFGFVRALSLGLFTEMYFV